MYELLSSCNRLYQFHRLCCMSQILHVMTSLKVNVRIQCTHQSLLFAISITFSNKESLFCYCNCINIVS